MALSAVYLAKVLSPETVQDNMRVVVAVEYALLLYRDKLPKFRNGLQIDENGKNIPKTGHMIFNWFDGGNEEEWGRTYYSNGTYMMWEKDKSKEVPKIHPAQKPVVVLKRLIEIFTDPGDVVIDPCAGSGTTLRAAYELGRSAYGFEIDRNFYQRAKDEMLNFAKKKKKNK